MSFSNRDANEEAPFMLSVTLDTLFASLELTVDLYRERPPNGEIVCDLLILDNRPAGHLILVLIGSAPLRLAFTGLSLIPSRAIDRGLVPMRRQTILHGELARLQADLFETAGVRMITATMSAYAPIAAGVLDGMRGPIIARLDHVPMAVAAFEATCDELRLQHAGSRTVSGALVKACLAFALRDGMAKESNFVLPPTVSDKRLSRAAAAIVDDPAQPHRVGTLAQIAGMSRSAFAKEFKAATGWSPMEFVTRTRLAHARTLLERTEMPISNVGVLSGFGDRSHFSRAFRTQYGVDPTTFRRRCREGVQDQAGED
ncbi:MAG: putative AraC family transcriptional regulator [Bradyrhizobium sp.]|nr:putative AraC family transcriptional regulator [Bradyrhizobium sp.]